METRHNTTFLLEENEKNKKIVTKSLEVQKDCVTLRLLPLGVFIPSARADRRAVFVERGKEHEDGEKIRYMNKVVSFAWLWRGSRLVKS